MGDAETPDRDYNHHLDCPVRYRDRAVCRCQAIREEEVKAEVRKSAAEAREFHQAGVEPVLSVAGSCAREQEGMPCVCKGGFGCKSSVCLNYLSPETPVRDARHLPGCPRHLQINAGCTCAGPWEARPPAAMREDYDPADVMVDPPTTNLNLKELLLGDLNRLRLTWRFNMRTVIHRENVAEHGYFVMLYAFFLAQTVDDVDLSDVMVRAMVHDWDESRTGDFSRAFKHSHPELQRTIERFARIEFETAVDPVLANPGVTKSLLQRWDTAKDGSREGRIVALADFLSVFSHMWQEVTTGNFAIVSEYGPMCEYMAKFNEEDFDFLRPVVAEAQRLVHVVLGDEELHRIVNLGSK